MRLIFQRELLLTHVHVNKKCTTRSFGAKSWPQSSRSPWEKNILTDRRGRTCINLLFKWLCSRIGAFFLSNSVENGHQVYRKSRHFINTLQRRFQSLSDLPKAYYVVNYEEDPSIQKVAPDLWLASLQT